MKIFIDPGHNYSGADTGAAGNGLREQDVSYFVGSYLAKYLSDAGFLVKCSRNKLADNVAATFNRSINYRYMQANEFKADYFISLHCDATADKNAKGAHVCVYSKNSTAEKLAGAVIKKLIPLGLDGRSEKIVERKNLGVLKHTNMPAILIEMGFITNPENANLMRSPEVIARAIFEGICEFTGVKTEKEYMSVNDAIALMSDRGIISDTEKWYNGTWNDADFKWLLRKVGTYIADKM